jgi:hypothetical protein
VPTWSWASVESLTGVGYWDKILFTDLENDDFNERPPYVHYSQVEACEVTKSAIHKFGHIASGLFTISGLVAEGVLGRDVQ